MFFVNHLLAVESLRYAGRHTALILLMKLREVIQLGDCSSQFLWSWNSNSLIKPGVLAAVPIAVKPVASQ